MSLQAIYKPDLDMFEGQTAVFRARLVGLEGTLLTIATTNVITWTVFDLSGNTPDVAVATGTPAAADSVYNTPSLADWPFPDGGANFVVGIPAGSGAGQVPWAGLHRYRVRFVVTHDLVSGPTGAYPDGPFTFEFEVNVRPGFGG